MKLKDLIKSIKIIDYKGLLETDIISLSQKANEKKEKFLFFCYKGVNFDSHDFVMSAIDNGCVALIVERWVDCDLPQILVRNTRNIMPKVCKNFFKNPQKKLKLIGVTGTNGKTTTSSLIYQIFNHNNNDTALIGTNGIFYKDKIINNNMTTPDTVDLYYLFDEFVKNGIKNVVMEVSAHAIDLKKIKGLKYEVGIFTNLTQDHLDYFKTMGKYAICKSKFLTKNYCKNCIINIDDKYGQMFTKLCSAKVLTYGIDNPAQNFALNINMDISGSNFIVNVFDEILDIKTNFFCLFNIYNILSAIICAKIFKIDSDIIKQSLIKIKNVDGRLNVFTLRTGAKAIIDYAHTPDGLEKILFCLKNLSKDNSLITVFGCGGNRDRLKRSKMGRIAEIYSDFIYITNDNPRDEEPEKIAQNIIMGMKLNNYLIELDREKAINLAINKAKKGDIILIAGKGAEQYQEIKGVKYAFNDEEILRKFI